MYSYKSDTTQFLNEYLKQHPEEVEQRIQGRLRLWDVELNPDEQKAFAKANAPRGAYFYQAD